MGLRNNYRKSMPFFEVIVKDIACLMRESIYFIQNGGKQCILLYFIMNETHNIYPLGPGIKTRNQVLLQRNYAYFEEHLHQDIETMAE